MKCRVHGKTDVGKVRKQNEDHYLIDYELGLYIVCDGMGGHKDGAVASEMAAKTIAHLVRQEAEVLADYASDPSQALRERIREILRAAVHNASHTVWQAGDRDDDDPQSGMGTTLAMMLVCGRYAFVVHVGDSRVYLVRRGNMHRLTEDHSLLNEMVRQGHLTRERAAAYPYSNFVTRAIGIQPKVEADILHVELMNGDCYLICSDGLTKNTHEQDLLDAIRANDLEQLPDVLLFMANEAGGDDNTTVVVVGVGAEGTEQTLEHTDMVAKKIETLSSIPLFAGFDYSELVKLLDFIEMRSVKANEVVIHQGDLGDAMYIILRGSAGVYQREQIINELGPGDYFGELSLIDDVPRSASVAALTPLIYLMLDRPSFFDHLDQHPRAAVKIYRAFLKRLSKQLRQKDDELYRLRKIARMPSPHVPTAEHVAIPRSAVTGSVASSIDSAEDDTAKHASTSGTGEHDPTDAIERV